MNSEPFPYTIIHAFEYPYSKMYELLYLEKVRIKIVYFFSHCSIISIYLISWD